MPVETKIIKIVFVVLYSCRMCIVGGNPCEKLQLSKQEKFSRKTSAGSSIKLFSVVNNLDLKMVRFVIIVILTLCAIDFAFGDLDSLLALSDESNESSELVDFTPVRVVDASKPVHHLKIDHCTLCSSFKKNAILIARAVMDESPNENFNVTFGMKNGE